jgi:hypothetical protein
MPEPLPDTNRDHQCYHYQAPNGQRCGSPAMKGEYYCYHHLVKTNYKKNHRVLIDPEITRMELPPIEDRASIFIALAAVVHRLAENTIDTRRAGQIIYGLQVAMRALEPPRTQRTHSKPAAEAPPAAAPSNNRCHSGRAQRVEEPRGTTLATTADTTPPPNPAAPKTIPITKESLLYFLRSRHCYNCNAELFPAEELTERRNPGAPPEVIEEARPALPAPDPVILSEAPSLGEAAQSKDPNEAVILSEGRSPQSKDPETVRPATADHTFPAQPQTQPSPAETTATAAPTHPGGILPTLQAVAENRRPTGMAERKSGEPKPATFWVICCDYLIISLMAPAPTVRPPSRIAKRSPFSIATGVCSSISSETLSPGITISVPAGSLADPVTSVVRK